MSTTPRHSINDFPPTLAAAQARLQAVQPSAYARSRTVRRITGARFVLSLPVETAA